jgi:chromosome segregation ATPase
MQSYSLREAAELCGTTITAMRSRADRGSLKTVLHDGERRVPFAELERAGLLPDAELQQLRRRVVQLSEELMTSRQLVVSTERAAEAEREARERVEAALFQRQAAAAAAEAETLEARAELERSAAAAASTQLELDALEAELRTAGPIKAWKLARARRKSSDTA